MGTMSSKAWIRLMGNIEEDASAFLVKFGFELSQDVFGTIGNGGLKPCDDAYSIAGDVATKLQVIRHYLEDLPPYWVDEDVEKLCKTIVDKLQVAAKCRGISRHRSRTRKPLSVIFQSKSSGSADSENFLVIFWKEYMQIGIDLREACDTLHDKLGNEGDLGRLPDSVLADIDRADAQDDVDGNIFSALRSITECNPAFHETTAEADSNVSCHPTRLCLHELQNLESMSTRNIEVLVSTLNMHIWQEFYLAIPRGCPVADQQQCHETLCTQDNYVIENNQSLLSEGGFCELLDMDLNTRLFLLFQKNHGILFLKTKNEYPERSLRDGEGESLESVLLHYKLTPKDKVMLAYAIARSYWRYYDSELMQSKWTSDIIWFMPEKDSKRDRDQLALCAYLSLPLKGHNDALPDISDMKLLNHRWPRIFDIGVLLLEIGLGKPFTSLKRANPISQANYNHRAALNELNILESLGGNADWGGFQNHKKYFDQTIRFCLQDYRSVTASIQQKGPQYAATNPTISSSSTNLDWQESVSIRRKIFHKHVVRPLAWLAKKGFKVQTGDVTYVRKKTDPPPPTDGLQPLGPEIPGALFHSDIIPQMWLQDLRKISEWVQRELLRCRIKTRVRVAILDTGIDKSIPFFKQKPDFLKDIVYEKDFMKGNQSDITDTFGHGTLMARLILECAPGVEILVARVAQNTSELEKSHENIRDVSVQPSYDPNIKLVSLPQQAILWAGREGQADIISMSFGFPIDNKDISDAIETLQEERKQNIIFLASAGNSSTDDESFPARHHAVISVYATNCHGTFLESNSRSMTNGATILGTYGSDIPEDICNEFAHRYPNICQPGCSVSTAIMAGITATMLAYAPVMESKIPSMGMIIGPHHEVLQCLRTTRGMEVVLRRLAQTNDDYSKYRAVKPMWFWKKRPTDSQRYAAIFDALGDIYGKYPIVR